MASDNHVHYERIGMVVIAGAIAIAATLVYLGGFRDRNSEFLIETYYDYPVSGLSEGSPVNLSGVKVGEVREIGFAEHIYWESGANTTGFKRVCIVMALQKDKFGGVDEFNEAYLREVMRDNIAQGLRATLAMNGITGLARIDLKMIDNPPPIEHISWQPRYPMIPPAPSLLESFSVTASRILDRLKKVDFDSVWSNVHVTAESLSRLTSNADATFESNRAGVSELLQDIHQISTEVREMTRTLNENPSLIFRPRDAEALPETAR